MIREDLLENLVGFWIKQAYFALLSGADENLEHLGINAQKYTLLAMIHMNPGIIQSRLVERVYLTRSTSSLLLEKLVQGGLVVRKSIDRKSNGLYLSRKGSKVTIEANALAQQHDEEATVHLTGREVATLKKLLRKLADGRLAGPGAE